MLFRLLLCLFTAVSLRAAESSASAVRRQGLTPLPASDEAATAMKRFRIPSGFKIELFAAEPMLANPVAFSIDERGRFFVAETYRHSAVGPAFRFNEGVFDIRSHMDWLDQDLASRTVGDRVALLQRNLGPAFNRLTEISEKVRLIEDRNHDGKADFSTVFAEGFNRAADGIGAGVLARHGSVYYTCIPDLWLLGATNANGTASARQSLHTGFGVHIAFLGHDLHGLRIGPDGRLYFSIGDRGINVTTREGKPLVYPDEGLVMRCELDGSNLEVFAHGLRNPQELAFDDFGNLFTGDNNSDGGDRARWVYVVEGGDSGWRIGYQTLTAPPRRGPWNAERLWHPHFEGQPAYIVPPIANLGYGPSGVSYYPGTGLPERYRGRFFLCDFRGGASSGIHSFGVMQRGASFELGAYEQFIWESLPTDVEFGVEGGIYFSDWVEGWNKTGKGRIYHVFDPSLDRAQIDETKKLLATDLKKLPPAKLRELLTHPDQRVRCEAQFAFVAQGEKGLSQLAAIALTSSNRTATIHSIWGLSQAARKGNTNAHLTLLVATRNTDSEVRAQSAKGLAESPLPQAADALVPLLTDPEPRVRFFAAIGLGRLKHRAAIPQLFAMLADNNDRDPYLRHAAVAGLTGIADIATLRSAATNSSSTIRMGACLALRRLGDASIQEFLHDQNIAIAVEAARAINDVGIDTAMPALASLIAKTDLLKNDTTTTKTAKASGVESAVSAIAVDTGITTVGEQLFLRVINANFRVGADTNANALATFAAATSAPPKLRADAINALAAWEKPPGRDRVTGLWRPVAPLSGQPARASLTKNISDLLTDSTTEVQIAAAGAARELAITNAIPQLIALANSESNSALVRLEALKSIAKLDRPQTRQVLDSALNSHNGSLQAEATRLLAELDPAAAMTRVKAELNSDALPKRRAAYNALALLPGSEPDQLLLASLDKLLREQIAPELQLDLLDAAGKRSSREVLDRVQQFEAKRNAADPLAAFAECLQGGDAAEGRKIFFERAEVFCSRCHQVNGDGGEAGPKLTGVGARQPRSYLLESIILPNAKIAQGWENVVVSLNDGRSFAGSVKSETDTKLFLNSPEDGDVTINKADIKSRNRALSAMPDEFRQILTKHELRDLVEFLASQQ